MNLNQLKNFIKLAECLSFTEASKCLFISQPTLSRQISVLEEELGTPLFVREKKKLRLTPGGSLLYNRLPELLSSFEQTLSEVQEANMGYEGKLHIGFLDIYDSRQFFDLCLRPFQEAHGNIELNIARYALDELPRKLYDKTLDLAITYNFSLFDQPDLLHVVVQNYNSCILMRKDHPLAERENLSLYDLREETFVQLGHGPSEEGYQYILNLCLKSGFRPKQRYVEKNEDVPLWVQSGDYVAITSDVSIEKYNPDLVIREIDLPQAKNHDIYLAWYKGNYNPAIAMFVETLKDKLPFAGTSGHRNPRNLF